MYKYLILLMLFACAPKPKKCANYAYWVGKYGQTLERNCSTLTYTRAEPATCLLSGEYTRVTYNNPTGERSNDIYWDLPRSCAHNKPTVQLCYLAESYEGAVLSCQMGHGEHGLAIHAAFWLVETSK